MKEKHDYGGSCERGGMSIERGYIGFPTALQTQLHCIQLPLNVSTPRLWHSLVLTTLVDIPEVHVLPVRQISKRRSIQITALKTSFLRHLYLIASTIFSSHEHPERDNQDNFNKVAVPLSVKCLGRMKR